MASEQPHRRQSHGHAARASAESTGGPGATGERQAQDELEAALGQALPGLAVLDRDLELGSGLSADVVGRVPDGRIVLVIECDGEGDAPVLAALDALAFAARHAGSLERHLGVEAASAGAESPAGGARRTLVVLVSPRFTRKLQERLAPMTGGATGAAGEAAGPGRPGGDVALFELHRLKSRRGASAWLVPVTPLAGVAPERRTTPEQFLAGLPGGLMEIASQLARRIPRLDAAIEPSATEGGLAWSLRGAVVARVTRASHVDGALCASAHPHAGHRLLRTAGEVDPFLEEILRGYLQLAGARLEPETRSTSSAVAGEPLPIAAGAAVAGSPPADEPVGVGRGGAGRAGGGAHPPAVPTVDVSVARLTRPQPALTPEEYQAFRE